MVAWRALVLAIGVCYYLRLDSQYVRPDGSLVDLRSEFRLKFDREVDQASAALRPLLAAHRCVRVRASSAHYSIVCVCAHAGAISPPGLPDPFPLLPLIPLFRFYDILNGACVSFFEKCKIPRGIARTNGLVENMVSGGVVCARSAAWVPLIACSGASLCSLPRRFVSRRALAC